MSHALYRMMTCQMPKADREALGSKGREFFLTHFERERLLDRFELWMDESCAS